MKFEMPAELFRQVSDIIKTIISFKDEDYNQLLLEVDEDNLFISSSDPSVGLTIKLPKKLFEGIVGTEPGSCLVEANTLLKVISAIKPFSEKDNKGCQSIVLSEEGPKAKISYTNFYNETKSAEHTRQLPKFESARVQRTWMDKEGTSYIIFPSKELNAALSKVVYASGIDELDMRLGNISFDILEENGESIIRLIATNGVKLAKYLIKTDKEHYKNVSNFLLPTKLAKKLLKIVSSSDSASDVVLSFSNDHRMLIKSIDSYTTVSCPIFVGGFPNCDGLFSGATDAVTLDTELLFDAVFSVQQIADEDDNRISAEFKDGQCKIYVAGNVSGESTGIRTHGALVSRLYDFNAKLLLDTLKNIKTESVKIQFFNEGPNRVSLEEDTNSPYGLKSILVPLRRF